MAIFKKKTKKETAVAAKDDAVKAGVATKSTMSPRITEKSAILAEKGTYVFEVAPRMNKVEVAKAVRALHNVTPVRVNMVNLPRTNVFVRGKKGVKSGVRKALVTLKKGDKIEFM